MLETVLFLFPNILVDRKLLRRPRYRILAKPLRPGVHFLPAIQYSTDEVDGKGVVVERWFWDLPERCLLDYPQHMTYLLRFHPIPRALL